MNERERVREEERQVKIEELYSLISYDETKTK